MALGIVLRSSFHVIASEAKQSTSQLGGRWIASSLALLAMTGLDTFTAFDASAGQPSPFKPRVI
jgi:hypothetical protein